MKYPQAQEALAKSQYERFTKRKWDSATVQDKSLWLGGAALDLRALGISNPENYSAGHAVLPRCLDEAAATVFGDIFTKQIVQKATLQNAISSAYYHFTETLVK